MDPSIKLISLTGFSRAISRIKNFFAKKIMIDVDDQNVSDYSSWLDAVEYYQPYIYSCESRSGYLPLSSVDVGYGCFTFAGYNPLSGKVEGRAFNSDVRNNSYYYVSVPLTYEVVHVSGNYSANNRLTIYGGKYYVWEGTTVNGLYFNLNNAYFTTEMVDSTRINAAVSCMSFIRFKAGSSPTVSFTAGNTQILYQDGFSIEANHTYEIGVTYNGREFIVSCLDFGE